MTTLNHNSCFFNYYSLLMLGVKGIKNNITLKLLQKSWLLALMSLQVSLAVFSKKLDLMSFHSICFILKKSKNMPIMY